MKESAVTIVMPAYRAERYIGEAVASVLAQTCPDWELLVVVDASPDESAAAAEKAAAGDPRVRILRLPANVGVAEARMAGVREAKTAWVAFLDSDDAWTPEKLERQLAFAEKTGADLVFTGSGFMDEEGKRIDRILHVPEKISYRELLKQNLISCSSVLVKRELMLRYPMRLTGSRAKGRMHEDFASWLRMLRGGAKAYGIDEPMLIYRVSRGSVSGNKSKAAAMTWRVYRNIGLSLPECVYYFCCYAVRSLKKWRGLRK